MTNASSAGVSSCALRTSLLAGSGPKVPAGGGEDLPFLRVLHVGWGTIHEPQSVRRELYIPASGQVARVVDGRDGTSSRPVERLAIDVQPPQLPRVRDVLYRGGHISPFFFVFSDGYGPPVGGTKSSAGTTTVAVWPLIVIVPTTTF